MSSRLIIGVMSGTSVDAIDAALVRVEGRAGKYRARVIAHVEHRWPAGLRRRLLAVMAPARTTTAELCQLNFAVAREFAAAVEKAVAAAHVRCAEITAIGSHGQTVCHLSPGQSRIENRKSKIGSTLQLGDPSVIATLTGIPTVGDFRAADMAVGGQGAPLVPWADAMLLAHRVKTRCVQNIGGIANVTYLPTTAPQGVVAFDTGPGNMLIDAVVSLATGGRRAYDRDGRMAGRGKLDEALLARLKADPYFVRRPPKSTGREDFGIQLARQMLRQTENRKSKIENVVHTLTRLTAWSIADAYRRYLPRMPDEVILCGGGAENPVLVAMLREELQGVSLRRIEEFGIPNKAKEAASFALLAAATLDGVPANVLSVTGARRLVVLGVVARPG